MAFHVEPWKPGEGTGGEPCEEAAPESGRGEVRTDKMQDNKAQWGQGLHLS